MPSSELRESRVKGSRTVRIKMGIPEKADARYSNGAGDDTKVTFISGNQKYTTDQEKGKTIQLT